MTHEAASDAPFDPGCELCRADRYTEWYYEDDQCWVAECESCSVPMVVWKRHDPDPPEEIRVELQSILSGIATTLMAEHWLDGNMRSIPTHFHVHARPRGGFWSRRT
jgi:hypothetical protein